MMWGPDDVILVAHNLIVRMQQNGYFRDNTGVDYLISEFYVRDQDAEATAEYEANRQRNRENTATDWDEQTFRCVINDVQYMDFESLFRRRRN